MRQNSPTGLNPSELRLSSVCYKYTSVKKAFKNDDLRLKAMLGAIYHVLYRAQAACKAAGKDFSDWGEVLSKLCS